MTQVVYSAQKRGFDKNRTYQNPRYFNGVLHPGATSVIIVGKWPSVEEAYKAAKIPVQVVSEGDKLPSIGDDGKADNVSKQVTTEHKDSIVKGSGADVGEIDPPLALGRNVEVPENVDKLSYRELKRLAAKIGDDLGQEVPDLPGKDDVLNYISAYQKGKQTAE